MKDCGPQGPAGPAGPAPLTVYDANDQVVGRVLSMDGPYPIVALPLGDGRSTPVRVSDRIERTQGFDDAIYFTEPLCSGPTFVRASPSPLTASVFLAPWSGVIYVPEAGSVPADILIRSLIRNPSAGCDNNGGGTTVISGQSAVLWGEPNAVFAPPFSVR